jgi:hypothetical protein
MHTSREIVSRLMKTLHTIVQVCVTTIAHAHRAVLHPVWILDVKIDLAVFAIFAGCDVGTYGRSISIEHCNPPRLFISFLQA